MASITTCGPSIGNGSFVTFGKLKRAQDGVHARGGVVDQRQIVRVAREHFSKGAAGGCHLFKPFTVEKSHRLVFHAVLPVSLFLTNRRWRGTKGAVVEEHRLGVEPPVHRQRATRRSVHGRGGLLQVIQPFFVAAYLEKVGKTPFFSHLPQKQIKQQREIDRYG